MSPKCFFIMRAHNTEEYIGEAIESILNQTEPSFYFLLHDNGSTDGSKEICERYAASDKRIILYRTENNQKFSDPEAWGFIKEQLYKSNAEYFAILDSDDRYHSDFLEKMYRMAESDQSEIVFCGWDYMDVRGNMLQEKIVPPNLKVRDKVFDADDYIAMFWPFHTLWCNLYRKEIFEYFWQGICALPENATNAKDYYLMQELLEHITAISAIDEVLLTYRRRHKGRYYNSIINNNWLLKLPYLFLKRNLKLAEYFVITGNTEKVEGFFFDKAYSELNSNIELIESDAEERRKDKLGSILFLINDPCFQELAARKPEIYAVVHEALRKTMKNADEDEKQIYALYEKKYMNEQNKKCWKLPFSEWLPYKIQKGILSVKIYLKRVLQRGK